MRAILFLGRKSEVNIPPTIQDHTEKAELADYVEESECHSEFWDAAELMIVSGGWSSISVTTTAHYTSTDKLAMNIRGNSAASTGSPTAVVGNPVTDDVFREGPQVSQRRYPIATPMGILSRLPYGNAVPRSVPAWQSSTSRSCWWLSRDLPSSLPQPAPTSAHVLRVPAWDSSSSINGSTEGTTPRHKVDHSILASVSIKLLTSVMLP